MHHRPFLYSSFAGGSFAALLSLTSKTGSETVTAFQKTLGQQSSKNSLMT